MVKKSPHLRRFATTPRWRGKVKGKIGTPALGQTKEKVRKKTGWGNDLRRRPCKTSPSLEALVDDNGIPSIYAWGVCQEKEKVSDAEDD